MKPFFALLRLSFKQLLLTSFNVGGGKKKKAATGIGAFLMLSFLMLYLSGTYSFMLASSLHMLHALDLMLMLMVILCVLFSFTFTVFSAQTLVFSTKDVDLVLSLPVSAFQVLLARVLALYLEIFMMVGLFLAPTGAAWLLYGGGGGVLFILRLVVGALLLSLLPTAAGLLFGLLVSFIVSKLPHKNIFLSVVSLLLFVGVMILSFTLQQGMEQIMAMPSVIRAQLRTALPPLAWITDFIANGSAVGLFLTVLVTVLPFLAVAWVISRFYKSLLSMLSSHHLKSNYRLGNIKYSGRVAALIKKEASKFFGSPAYLMNSGVGTFMLIGGSVVALFFKSRITPLMAFIATGSGGAVFDLMPGILLAIIGFFFGVSNTSSVSISLEGRTLWILKEAPISDDLHFFVKAGFSFLVTGLPSLICIPMLGYVFGLPVYTTLLTLLTILLFCLFTSMSGLFINLLLPRMDAENDTLVVKQSVSVFVNMLVNTVLVLGFGFLYYYCFSRGGFRTFSLIALPLLLLLCLGAFLLLRTKGRKLFNAL